MIDHGHCFCDLCGQHMGQLWNQPAIASDLLPPPDFRVCEDCFPASEPTPIRYQIFGQVLAQGDVIGTDPFAGAL